MFINRIGLQWHPNIEVCVWKLLNINFKKPSFLYHYGNINQKKDTFFIL